MSDAHPGTLHGIGVGPGDPELMTLKAHRLISAARIVAYPAPDSGHSFARSIAAAAIHPDAVEIPMIVPMRVARFPAQDVYASAAETIAGHLSAGDDVAVLCEGDPFFYGSFMYLFARLAARFTCEIVPGVSSLAACSAALACPLTARNDVLTVLPGPVDDDTLRARIEAAEAIAIMKVGRHLPRIRALLDDMGLTAQAGYVERASLPEQRVMPLADMPKDTPKDTPKGAPEGAPYFSMILIYKGNDPWLTTP